MLDGYSKDNEAYLTPDFNTMVGEFETIKKLIEQIKNLQPKNIGEENRELKKEDNNYSGIKPTLSYHTTTTFVLCKPICLLR